MLALSVPRPPVRLFDLALVAVYLAATTFIGLRFSKSSRRSMRSYFLADRKVPWWAIALSIVAAETSVLTIISVPGLAFTGDFGFLQIALGYLLGRIIICVLFLPRYIRSDLLTAYQFIASRFGQRLQSSTALLFLLLRAGAEGVRVFAVAIVVSTAFGTPDIVSIAILSALTLLYTFQGGMAAVIWTDVAQMALYALGSFVALATICSRIPGGWPALLAGASAAHKLTFLHFSWALGQSYTFQAGLIGGCFLTLASHGTDQLMVQRLLAARNLRDSQVALLVSGAIVFLQFTLFLMIGAGLFVYYGGNAPMASPDRVFPDFIAHEMPMGISGLMIAAILAAAMSNLSASLNSLAATSMIDLYIPHHPGLKEQERIRLSRLITIGWSVVLFALALLSRRGGHVVEVGLSIASALSGAMLGVFLLGALSRRTTENGAMAGMLAGVAVNLLLWLQPHDLNVSLLGIPFTLPKIAWTWWVLVGSVLTFVVGYFASLISLRPPASR